MLRLGSLWCRRSFLSLAIVLGLAETCVAAGQSMSVMVSFSFNRYYRYEGQTKDALTIVPIEVWSPYEEAPRRVQPFTSW